MTGAAACEGCRFAVPRIIPLGPEPQEPVPPSGFFARLMWPGDWKWREYHLMTKRHAARKLDNDRLMICQRFPETEIKLRTDTCGEFQAAEAVQ